MLYPLFEECIFPLVSCYLIGCVFSASLDVIWCSRLRYWLLPQSQQLTREVGVCPGSYSYLHAHCAFP
jgi:hypothetical protein